MYNTALIGLGRIASLYNEDLRMNRSIEYSTHGKVLSQHPEFKWIAAVDPDVDACLYAKDVWGIDSVATSIDRLSCRDEVEIVVLATPPDTRKEIIEKFPSLVAIIVEKPLGKSFKEAQAFVEYCNSRNIRIQVNLNRRSDELMKSLSENGIYDRIGRVQNVYGTYGRGLRNYGIHLIDLVRFLIGEIATVQAIANIENLDEGPLANDINIIFALETFDNTRIIFQPLDFNHYREGHIDIWGEKGRIEITNEGLIYNETTIGSCRSLEGAKELAYESMLYKKTGYGVSLYNLYTNLISTLSGKTTLDSPGNSALASESVVDALFKSNEMGGSVVRPD